MTMRRATRSWKRWFSLGFEETSREGQRHMQSVFRSRSTGAAQGNDGEAACRRSIDSCGSQKQRVGGERVDVYDAENGTEDGSLGDSPD